MPAWHGAWSGLGPHSTDEERLRNGPPILYRVDLSPVDSDALFIAGLPAFLNVLNVDVPSLLRVDGVDYRLGFVPSTAIRYEVQSAISTPFAPGRVVLNRAERAQYLQLPAALDSRIPQLARQLMQGREDLQRARSLERGLRANFSYSLKFPDSPPRDPLRQTLQFALVHDVVVDHAEQQLLDRAAAEALDDLTDGFRGHVLRRVDAAINIGAALDAVAHVAFLLQPLEDRAGGRLLQGLASGKVRPDTLGRGCPAAPDHFHHEVFELAQSFSGSVSAKHCSATKCSVYCNRGQALFFSSTTLQMAAAHESSVKRRANPE